MAKNPLHSRFSTVYYLDNTARCGENSGQAVLLQSCTSRVVRPSFRVEPGITLALFSLLRGRYPAPPKWVEGAKHERKGTWLGLKARSSGLTTPRGSVSSGGTTGLMCSFIIPASPVKVTKASRKAMTWS